jgi:N-acetylated-alpha-linked acidic dipeptidase
MRYLLPVLFSLLSVSFIYGQKIMGFTDARADQQLDWEKQFDAQLSGKEQDTWMQFLSSHPHHVGSPQDKANAEYIVSLFRSWGWETEIAEYWPLFPTPKIRVL